MSVMRVWQPSRRTAVPSQRAWQTAQVRIVYNSFHGRFSDNPRAVYERLVGRRSLDQVWLADPQHAATFLSLIHI